jgi:hypothetical protein
MKIFIRHLTSLVIIIALLLAGIELILYAIHREPYNWTPLYILAIALVVNRLTFNK